MSDLFDIYRSGYQLWQDLGCSGQRRRTPWELRITCGQLRLTFVNTGSFIEGYHSDYADTMRLQDALRQLRPAN